MLLSCVSDGESRPQTSTSIGIIMVNENEVPGIVNGNTVTKNVLSSIVVMLKNM